MSELVAGADAASSRATGAESAAPVYVGKRPRAPSMEYSAESSRPRAPSEASSEAAAPPDGFVRVGHVSEFVPAVGHDRDGILFRALRRGNGWDGEPVAIKLGWRGTSLAHEAAVLSALTAAKARGFPAFRHHGKQRVEGVPSELLDPSSSWADKADFRRTQAELAALFAKNFTKYAAECSAEVIACGPKA